MDDDPTGPLEYATPAMESAGSKHGVDTAVGVLSGISILLGAMVTAGAASDLARTSRLHHSSDNFFPALGVCAAYSALSITAFLGSIQPVGYKRRRFYRIYVAGFLIALVILETIVVMTVDPIRGDKDVYWQGPVMAGIANPTMIVMVVRLWTRHELAPNR